MWFCFKDASQIRLRKGRALKRHGVKTSPSRFCAHFLLGGDVIHTVEKGIVDLLLAAVYSRVEHDQIYQVSEVEAAENAGRIVGVNLGAGHPLEVCLECVGLQKRFKNMG
jgi:hypothetical protein